MEPTRTLQAPTDDVPVEKTLSSTLDVDSGPGVTLDDVRPGMLGLLREAGAGIALLPRLGARFLAKFIYGTKLGRSWLVIRPLMDSLGMTLLFGGVLKVSAPGAVPYYLFIMAGLLCWRLFERSARYGTRSFAVYRKMMMTFRFPLLLVPIAALAYPAVEIAVYWLVFLGAVAFFWAMDGRLWLEGLPDLLLVAPALVLLAVMTIGLLLWTSVLNAKARDTRLLLRYVMSVWLFLTPVIYPVSQLPPDVRWVAIVNPMSAPVELMKSGLIGTPGPSAGMLAWSIGLSGLLMVSGLWFFNREAARSIDAISGGMDDDEDEM